MFGFGWFWLVLVSFGLILVGLVWFGIVGRGYVMNFDRVDVIKVGRGYVIQNSQSVSQ